MLSDNEIMQLIEADELEITDFDPDEQLTPVGVDLTVGPSYKRPATQEVFHSESNNGQLILEPDTFYHLHTVESVSIPDGYYGSTEVIMERSLEGIQVTTGIVEPGFEGRLLLGVENVSETSTALDVGDRIVQVTFDKLRSESDETYEGDTHYERNL